MIPPLSERFSHLPRQMLSVEMDFKSNDEDLGFEDDDFSSGDDDFLSEETISQKR
jgi:hypothetical protein